jgi:hypothetical protein
MKKNKLFCVTEVNRLNQVIAALIGLDLKKPKAKPKNGESISECLIF